MSHLDSEGRSKPKFKAGKELLAQFQDRWHHFHINTEICTKKAQEAVDRLDKLQDSSTKLSNSLELLVVGSKSLAGLDKKIQIINNELIKLKQYFDQIEILLTSAKNNQEEKELEKFKQRLDHETELSIQIQKVQSESRKELIKEEYENKLKEIELKQEKELEERRKIYEKAFEKEKSKYLESRQP